MYFDRTNIYSRDNKNANILEEIDTLASNVQY